MVVLGNPPWDQLQFSDGEFFASRHPEIAALAGDTRKKAIADLESAEPILWSELLRSIWNVEAQNSFFRTSGQKFEKMNSVPLRSKLSEATHSRESVLRIQDQLSLSCVYHQQVQLFLGGDLQKTRRH